MLKFKSAQPYWAEFSAYQSFETVEAMIEQIKHFESIYELTPSVKAVLNTIKLHSKRFIGVCWLYREEIAKKAKVSLSSVKRAIKSLQEAGILTVKPFTHTKRGGKTHNIYILQPITEPSVDPSNEPSVEVSEEPETPVVSTVCEIPSETHKNSYTNSNKTLKDISNKVPSEFISLMEPFYANQPEIILARWKTVCVAVKKNCGSFAMTSWESIGAAWKDTVRKLKRGRIEKATDDGVGGYFYGVLCDYLMDDYWRNASSLA